jgi:hypothetical protein
MRKLRNLAVVVLFFFVLSILGSCVSAPRYGDYMDLPKEYALQELEGKKVSNGVKLALNWVLWGWVGLYIPSIIDTIKVISYIDDFQAVEYRIKATEPTPVVDEVKAQTTAETHSRTTGATVGIEGAIYRAIKVLIDGLPDRSKIAVLTISSKDRDSAIFVMDELEFQLVDTGSFTVVDRKTLDQVRNEQNFQSSGGVDDDSAVSMGKMLGADIVITGSISGTGSTQRLTLKALDVQTAQIVTMARESF